MAGIVFYFEDNDVDTWSGRHSDLDAWNYAIQLTSDVRDVYIINKTDQSFSFNLEFNTTYVTDQPTLTGNVTQIICPWEHMGDSFPEGAVCEHLWDFDHETDWYLFGPARGWGANLFADRFICIPQNGQVACHSVHIATMIMAHRYHIKG
jgi:hypothetical protein